jgi:hypothetical protein
MNNDQPDKKDLKFVRNNHFSCLIAGKLAYLLSNIQLPHDGKLI